MQPHRSALGILNRCGETSESSSAAFFPFRSGPGLPPSATNPLELSKLFLTAKTEKWAKPTLSEVVLVRWLLEFTDDVEDLLL